MLLVLEERKMAKRNRNMGANISEKSERPGPSFTVDRGQDKDVDLLHTYWFERRRRISFL
jgi:hypothetical protein